jgi:hypothetical protein
VTTGQASLPFVRLELHTPADSKAHFEAVMGE